MCGGPLASENSVKVKLSQIMAGGDLWQAKILEGKNPI